MRRPTIFVGGGFFAHGNVQPASPPPEPPDISRRGDGSPGRGAFSLTPGQLGPSRDGGGPVDIQDEGGYGSCVIPGSGADCPAGYEPWPDAFDDQGNQLCWPTSMRSVSPTGVMVVCPPPPGAGADVPGADFQNWQDAQGNNLDDNGNPVDAQGNPVQPPDFGPPGGPPDMGPGPAVVAPPTPSGQPGQVESYEESYMFAAPGGQQCEGPDYGYGFDADCNVLDSYGMPVQYDDQGNVYDSQGELMTTAPTDLYSQINGTLGDSGLMGAAPRMVQRGGGRRRRRPPNARRAIYRLRSPRARARGRSLAAARRVAQRFPVLEYRGGLYSTRPQPWTDRPPSILPGAAVRRAPPQRYAAPRQQPTVSRGPAPYVIKGGVGAYGWSRKRCHPDRDSWATYVVDTYNQGMPYPVVSGYCTLADCHNNMKK